MKKPIALFLGLTLVFGLCACGSQKPAEDAPVQAAEDSEETSVEAETEEPEEKTQAPETEAPEASDGQEKKTLVVYYSASGNTKEAAEYIASASNADLFELVPQESYTDEDLDWTDDDSRVVYEHDNPDARDVKLVEAEVPDWESYETVYIGYPIWWGIAAWPVNEFVTTNDFTGKTVIPFCTSASSGLGESGTLLEEMAGTGDWLEGERFASGVSEESVTTWVEGLGL